MSKQIDQWGDGGYQNYDYDSGDYSYNQSEEHEVQPTRHYAVSAYVEDNNQLSSYEQSWRTHDRDRQTGTYTTASTKAVASRGETFKERATAGELAPRTSSKPRPLTGLETKVDILSISVKRGSAE